MKKVISAAKAPKAIGPYSQAVKQGGLIFISGQLPIDSNGQMPQTEKEQTVIALNNIKAILESENLGMEKILKTTVFMTDLSKFPEMNEEYGKFFAENPPARATIEVKGLPKGAKVEIEAIAAAD